MLKVADIMAPNPITVELDTPLGEVIGLMKSHGFRQLPVMDKGRLVGIITDRDVRLILNSPLVLHERAEDQAMLKNVTAETCMTPNPMTIDADAPAVEAAELLVKYKFGSLPVLKDNRLVGIITVVDIMRSYVDLLAK